MQRKIDLRQWAENPAPIFAISELIGSIGTNRFAERLLTLFNNFTLVDHCSVYVRAEGGTIETLLSAGAAAMRTGHPHIRACIDMETEGFISEGGDRSKVAAFRQNAERTVFASDDAKVLVVQDAENRNIHTCLSRLYSRRFEPSEIATVELYSPLLMSAIRQHLALHQAADETDGGLGDLPVERRQKLLNHIQADLMRFGSISPREAEVCAHIAIGYNVNAISLLLGISQNTASTHRKRAYAKLGISSQNELFARYLDFSPSTSRPVRQSA